MTPFNLIEFQKTFVFYYFRNELLFYSIMSNTENNKWAQFDSADLDLLQKALEEKDENIDAVIKTVLAKYNLDNAGAFTYPGLIFSTSEEDLFDEIAKTIDFLFPSKPEIANEFDAIKNSEDSTTAKWHKGLQLLSSKLNENDGALLSALTPNGGSDYVFLSFPDNNYVAAITLLYHFSDTWNNASGWFDEYIQDFNISYSEHLSKLNTTADKIFELYEFTAVHDEFLGDRLEGNARSINLSENNFNAAKSGMIAAKKYC